MSLNWKITQDRELLLEIARVRPKKYFSNAKKHITNIISKRVVVR